MLPKLTTVPFTKTDSALSVLLASSSMTTLVYDSHLNVNKLTPEDSVLNASRVSQSNTVSVSKTLLSSTVLLLSTRTVKVSVWKVIYWTVSSMCLLQASARHAFLDTQSTVKEGVCSHVLLRQKPKVHVGEWVMCRNWHQLWCVQCWRIMCRLPRVLLHDSRNLQEVHSRQFPWNQSR